MSLPQFAVALTQPPSYLFDLGITFPKQAFQPYSKVLDLGNGETKRMGYSMIEWYWAFLSITQIQNLAILCPNGSVEVYVRSLNQILAWHTYRAKMIWPAEAAEIENDYRMKVTARFRVLEQMD